MKLWSMRQFGKKKIAELSKHHKRQGDWRWNRSRLMLNLSASQLTQKYIHENRLEQNGNSSLSFCRNALCPFLSFWSSIALSRVPFIWFLILCCIMHIILFKEYWDVSLKNTYLNYDRLNIYEMFKSIYLSFVYITSNFSTFLSFWSLFILYVDKMWESMGYICL